MAHSPMPAGIYLATEVESLSLASLAEGGSWTSVGSESATTVDTQKLRDFFAELMTVRKRACNVDDPFQFGVGMRIKIIVLIY